MKYTEDIIKDMYHKYIIENKTQKEIAKEYGISLKSVYQIFRRHGIVKDANVVIENITNSRSLSSERIEQVKNLRDNGLKIREIANKLDLTNGQVSYILNNKLGG